MNKRKIINDPIYGFLNVHFDIIFDIIEHPYFQRLRRIRQLGLTNFVYPGANHTRFQHALGAMHLMELAINVINTKRNIITKKEAEAVTAAILMHDIGHGPFSHALEKIIVEDFHHEHLSLLIMTSINAQFDGKLNLAIDIFNNSYHKKFLHQLVSSQLDMDRLDYLKRDSFFTGVYEGVIGADRIIKMLDVHNDELVVENKGIYSIEKYLVARRLMYWQVYLHKTVVAAEKLLEKILIRAKELANQGVTLFTTPELHFFLYHEYKKGLNNKIDIKPLIEAFTYLDDHDIITAIKMWTRHEDKILSLLCQNLINRKLFKTEILNTPPSENQIQILREKVKSRYDLSEKEIDYFIFYESISNNAYNKSNEKINIIQKNGEILNISDISDIVDLHVLSKNIKKYFLCYPKEFSV